MAIFIKKSLFKKTQLNDFGEFYSVSWHPQEKEIYCRVSSCEVRKSSADCTVSFFENTSKLPMGYRRYRFEYSIDGENPIKQAYEYIKTLPEFEGAEDC